MKTIREFFDERSLKPTGIALMTGAPYVTVASHYYGKRRVSPRYARIYEMVFGIPKSEIRPDIWKPERRLFKNKG